ncbi:SPX3-like protein [Mya arenaria]|uniref:SPX3-like protein n=1 Tax=Mya arenaria TaxID=6604 RepID=A0ABY7FWV8_MYAAR|nr:SPX3-like protein [Mya arenaria]
MWTCHHVVIFILTFTSYSFFHATRKTFSNVKSTISSEWSSTPGNRTLCNKPEKLWTAHHMFDSSKDVETYLGILDAGLYISGMIGDRYELRKVLSIGMCLSAISVFVFGPVFEWSHFYNKYTYVLVWILNGLLQSMGWPTSWVCAGSMERLCVCGQHYRSSDGLSSAALVNYSFFFWLPYYLHNKFGWDESSADKISIWYDVGGIVGKQGPIQGNKAALATVTGIVDGTGSVGAALGQTVLTILCILPMFVREAPEFFREVRGSCRKYRYSWYCGIHKPQDMSANLSVNEDNDEAELSAD